MTTSPTPLDLYKTAGQRCALRDLGLISQTEFEKDAWVTAALAAAPMVWSGAKWLGKKIFGGGKAAAGAAKGGVGSARGMLQQTGQMGGQMGRQMAQPMMRPPVG